MILFMNKADILQQKILKSKPRPLKTLQEANRDYKPLYVDDIDEKGCSHRHSIKYPDEDDDTTSLTSISSSGGYDSDADIFSQEHSHPFNRYFPDYAGDPYDLEQVQEFLIMMFDSVRRLKHKRLFSHCTTAVDTKNIKIVFNDVRMTILQKNIHALMLQ
jgi:hypothetical protein